MLLDKTINAEDQCIPIKAKNAIQTVIKEEKLFWHYCNETLYHLQQLLDKGIHALNNHITTLINNSKFTHTHTHTDKGNLRNSATTKCIQISWCPWLNICLSGPRTVYMSIPFGQLQIIGIQLWTIPKSPGKRMCQVNNLSPTSSTSSSIHQEAITTHIKCSCCGYSHT